MTSQAAFFMGEARGVSVNQMPEASDQWSLRRRKMMVVAIEPAIRRGQTESSLSGWRLTKMDWMISDM